MPTQTTINTASPNTYLLKTFYDRKMLEWAKTQFVYANYGQKRSIPRNSGKTVEFRRWKLFDVNTATLELTEGVTPAGQSIGQTKVEATVKQYGAYVEVSDVLDMVGYDPVISDMSELLGEQIGTCLEWVTRDAMIAGASVQYAGGRAATSAITATDVLTVDDVRKAVRTLKKAKARKFTNGGKPHFICICDPDVTFDLQSDSKWEDVRKYQDKESIYNGELGRMYGVVFVESTEGKVSSQSVYTTVAAHTANSAVVTLAQMSDAAAAYLTAGAKIKIGTTEYTVASCDKAAKTVTLSAAVATAITVGTKVYSEDAGMLDSNSKGLDVHHSLIFGADAYGVIDIAGAGAIQSIAKPFGSGGTSDPLDQRATIACKVPAYAAKVLNPLWIIDIESAAS